MKELIYTLKRIHPFLITLAIIGVCGYTAYQISVVVSIVPDAKTIESDRGDAAATAVKFDTKTIAAIRAQTNVHVATDLGGIGNPNPFFGN